VCVVGRDDGARDQLVAFLHSGRRTRFVGRYGGLWEMLSEILYGAALSHMLPVGHVVMLGPLASCFMTALPAHAHRGASPLAAAFNALGIPRDAALSYEAAVRGRLFLLIVSADARGIEQARTLLDATSLESFPSTRPGTEPA
jgi:hypothetical protein